MNDSGYNERLFSKGFRARVHLARFAWLRKMTTRFQPEKPLRVVELGCFDGVPLIGCRSNLRCMMVLMPIGKAVWISGETVTHPIQPCDFMSALHPLL
jgi:hypothetical protein